MASPVASISECGACHLLAGLSDLGSVDTNEVVDGVPRAWADYSTVPQSTGYTDENRG